MNRDLGLNILSQIMDWDSDTSLDSMNEFEWILFISEFKYNGYRDYLAGARFVENFCTWLQQFDVDDRKIAYQFVKEKLIYFSREEIQRLVEKFFPDFVQKDLIKSVSSSLGIKSYNIWATDASTQEYAFEKRKSLFMGLSDGARIDLLRRGNTNILTNEQIVITTQTDQTKWKSLLDDLNKSLSKIRGTKITSNQKFSRVYLLDDFTASGTSILPDPDNTNGELKGKLVKFAKSVNDANDSIEGSIFEENYPIVVHHYIGTEQARDHINKVYNKEKSRLSDYGLGNVSFSFGLILPSNIKITATTNCQFVALCKKYYNSEIEGDGEHGGQSGTTKKMFGYANCGLPLVLEHNTPNNSLPLIWADTVGGKSKPEMRPLFRRRERHSDLERFKER